MELLFLNSPIVFDAVKVVAPYAGSAIVGGGIALGIMRRFSNWIYDRHFDEWLASATVSELDDEGYRWLLLDNMDSPKTFDGEVRGRDERKAMTKAAKRCSWDPTRRFLLGGERDGAAMLHVSRNALSGLWKDGARARLERRPVDTHTIFFGVTGADAAQGTKKKYRVILMNAEDMQLVLGHPDHLWRFADPTHRVRLETCRIMAQAWVDAGSPKTWQECSKIDPIVAGSVTVNDTKHPIVGWLRAYEPKLIAA